MLSILFSNAGRRATLIKFFKESLGDGVKTVATDNWSVAPALFMADAYHLTPKIDDDRYVETLLAICEQEGINAITSLIDPEIELLSKNRDLFISKGILPLCPDEDTAKLCFDKYAMYEYCRDHGIPTVLTFDSEESFAEARARGEIDFPVFIKPRTGSGSVGARRVESLSELQVALAEEDTSYIIQELMDCEDCDADVYVDTVSGEVVAAFSKRKIETRIGGASKTISFIDQDLFDLIDEVAGLMGLYGPLDIDFFYKDGTYYLSEINPRFGGAYLHAYGCGVDFPKLVARNVRGEKNERNVGDYKENRLMLMYDAAVFVDVEDLQGDYRD